MALRDFEHACVSDPKRYRRDVDGLLRFLDDHFGRWHPDKVTHGFVSGLVRAGRAWVLLDALEEVADFEHRIAVRQVVEGLADDFPDNRLLVTARVAAYEGRNTRLDERFNVATVRDLTRAQWTPLMDRLYGELEADLGVASRRAKQLVQRIDGSELLQEMVKTPLMVWTATLIDFADRQLPEQRAELYDAYVEVLLGERLKEEESAESARPLRDEPWTLAERKLYLTYAACETHRLAAEVQRDRRRHALTVVDEQDLIRRVLAPFMEEDRGLTKRAARIEVEKFVASVSCLPV